MPSLSSLKDTETTGGDQRKRQKKQILGRSRVWSWFSLGLSRISSEFSLCPVVILDLNMLFSFVFIPALILGLVLVLVPGQSLFRGNTVFTSRPPPSTGLKRLCFNEVRTPSSCQCLGLVQATLSPVLVRIQHQVEFWKLVLDLSFLVLARVHLGLVLLQSK